MTKIIEEVKVQEKQMKESEEEIVKEETAVKDYQTKMTKESTTKEQAATWKIEMEKR